MNIFIALLIVVNISLYAMESELQSFSKNYASTTGKVWVHFNAETNSVVGCHQTLQKSTFFIKKFMSNPALYQIENYSVGYDRNMYNYKNSYDPSFFQLDKPVDISILQELNQAMAEFTEQFNLFPTD